MVSERTEGVMMIKAKEVFGVSDINEITPELVDLVLNANYGDDILYKNKKYKSTVVLKACATIVKQMLDKQ